jgi:hypothetical protein
MPAIHLDYLVGSAAIDIFVMLAISIVIVAEMRRDHSAHQRMTTERWQSPPGRQTLTTGDQTERQQPGSNRVTSRFRLTNAP